MSNLLSLNEDDKAVLLKSFESMEISLFFLKQNLLNDSLTIEERSHLIQHIEKSFSTLKERLEFRPEEIFSTLESKSLDVLEKELSSCKEILIEDAELSKMPEVMKKFVKNVHSWWEKIGFHHVESAYMDQYGMIRLTLGFDVDFVDSLSLTPISDQKRNQNNYERLLEKGIVFLDTKRRFVKDCDQSRQAIARILEETVKDATVFSFDSKSLHNQEGFLLKRMVVHVRNPALLQIEKDIVVNPNA